MRVHAMEQVKSPIDGFRKTRFAVVRNTHPDPEADHDPDLAGLFSPRICTKPVQLGAGADAQDRVRRCALRGRLHGARPGLEDVRRLRSGEYTGIYFNELQYIIKELVDEATSRLALSEAGGRRLDMAAA